MTLWKWLLITLLILFPAVVSATDSQSQFMQVRIMIDSKEQFIQIQQMPLEIIQTGDRYIEIVTDPAGVSRLQYLGFRTVTIHDDLTEFYRNRLGAKGMGAYKTLSQLETELFFMNYGYPNIVSPMISIGKTLENRDIWAVKISDNPNIDEDEPEILYVGATHAREVITSEVILYFMNYLTQNYGTDPEVTYLVDNREMWFILVANPDGYSYNDINSPGGGGMWRKNRRDNGDGSVGVDLNRNFGYMWGYDDAGSSPQGSNETYRGQGPFSELETQALRDFITAHDFPITMYYHSHANLILWPWGYANNLYTPDENIFSAIGEKISFYNGYFPGPAWMLYLTNGTSDDWGYGEQTTKNKNFAFTVEVGTYDDGFWPPPGRIPILTEENLQPNILLANLVGNVYSILPPDPPLLTAPDSIPTGSGYNVDWMLHDTLNPAVNYELTEMQNRRIISDSANSFANWTNKDFVLANDNYHSPGKSFFSGSPSTVNRYIETAIPYTVQPDDSLKFWTSYSISENWDFAFVEISTDGLIYTTIPGNVTTDNNSYGHNRGYGITGYSAGWVEAKFDLSAYVGQSIYIRISYKVYSTYYAWEGIYVDDIRPVVKFGTTTVLSSSLTDTSYSIASRPDGLYYYRVRANDADGQWGRYSVIDNVTVGNPYICGDANGSGVVNIQDITFLINFLYKGGLAPIPVQAGDANGDGIINIRDITHLINFLYKGGPIPICP
ncbi:MAG: M14 family zinc carboxypeptidase [candidate division Zixibacteria bacterium]|nr:M14 family zinc carboxypeptidase [candidate division Zixibacteria bacterium]